MGNPKITCVTPSIRIELLEILKKCLLRQTFDSFEWIVVSPFKYQDAIWIPDPPMREGDYYRLNGAWNKAFRKARGELVVSIVDGLWFPPDTLEKLWQHYRNDPKSCVTCIGHQYDEVENGKPEHMVWRDPRARLDQGAFYEVSPREMELCVASLPLKAIRDVGGVDEEFDKYAALSEKEMCYRIEQQGYKFYIDQTLEYRAIHHPRLSEEWDKRYKEGCVYYEKCIKEILADGTRRVLDNFQ